jgi:integrase
MSGHIRKRGANSFELKYDTGLDPRTGKRNTKYVSFRGSKRAAQAKLTELLDAVAKGTHVDRSAVSVAEFVRSRIDQWEASDKISTKTATRYRELNAYQITRHIGQKALQKLRRLDIEEWHTVLRKSGRADGKGGIAPRTIAHAHHLLATALKDAKKDRLVLDVVTADETAPTVRDEEVLIVPDVPGFVERLKRAGRLYVPAMVSLFTGMRRNEVLALKWGRVDLDRNIIEVRESLEHTKTYGIRFKPPKSKAGRRNITLPDILIDVLREYRKSQLELHMKLGAGNTR